MCFVVLLSVAVYAYDNNKSLLSNNTACIWLRDLSEQDDTDVHKTKHLSNSPIDRV